MPFQMTSTTRRFSRVFMTTVFALSAIPDLLTVPHGEHLIKILPYLRGALPLPADRDADGSGGRAVRCAGSAGSGTSSITITVTGEVDDTGDSAANPLLTNILL
jgi:hypothetical protein